MIISTALKKSPLYKFLPFLFLFAVWCCKDDESDQFRLTVNHGSGSGNYAAGTPVTIEADEPPAGSEFDQWTGDVDRISDVSAASAALTMPAANIEITATYREAIPAKVITVNKNTRYQTMDGFGFFGGRDVWWGSSDPAHFHSEEWLDKVVGDLGISVWRNELYPHNPPDEQTTDNQDANWDKQKALVQALKAKADAQNVDLKIILTAWSPPGAFKWKVTNNTWPGDENSQRGPGPDGDYWSERNGGTFNPNKYEELAQWWIDAIQMYKDIDVDVYAISLQNEPAFQQTFNSCFYTTFWYADLVAAVVPLIKAAHPGVKVYGSENMLEMEGRADNYPYFYHNKLKTHATAMSQMDMLAVHGYSDGVSASSGSELAQLWTNHKEQFTAPASKKAWMTETSGYIDAWEKTEQKPGALSLALDIQTAILFGDVSAWVWWQGSSVAPIDEFSLMSNLTVGKKYYASKNFYRFIRPGAVRLEASAEDEDVSVTAFVNEELETHTLVIINASEETRPVTIEMSGTGVPTEYEMFVTSSSKNCESAGVKAANASISLPPRSVVTLQAGGNALGKP